MQRLPDSRRAIAGNFYIVPSAGESAKADFAVYSRGFQSAVHRLRASTSAAGVSGSMTAMVQKKQPSSQNEQGESAKGRTMGSSFSKIYIHLVWSTWHRLPLIKRQYEAPLHGYIRNICAEMGALLMTSGGTQDHVHLLIDVPPSVRVADLVKRIKGKTSHFTTHALAPDDFFKWQIGYAVFSVSEEHLPILRNYIRNQKEHHESGSVEPDFEPQLGDAGYSAPAD